VDKVRIYIAINYRRLYPSAKSTLFDTTSVKQSAVQRHILRIKGYKKCCICKQYVSTLYYGYYERSMCIGCSHVWKLAIRFHQNDKHLTGVIDPMSGFPIYEHRPLYLKDGK
jgi:hypothetical protein